MLTKELLFPNDLGQLEPRTVLIHSEGTRESRRIDTKLLTIGRAVLVTPVRADDRKKQKILVLPNFGFARPPGRRGISEASSVKNTITYLVGRKALVFGKNPLGTAGWTITKPVLFPSVSRAAGFSTGTSQDGWVEWKLRLSESEYISLDDAWTQSIAEKYTLPFYRGDDLPAEVIEVPPRF